MLESSDKLLKDLVESGESRDLEFKASAVYSFNTKQNDKTLFYPIIKTICAFANTEGGKLLVGYNEKSNEFNGIEVDGKKNLDDWERFIRSHLDQKTDKTTGTMVNFFFHKINNVTCALIEVARSPHRISCKDISSNEQTHFYVRSGPSTKSLNFDEGIKYRNMRFGGDGDRPRRYRRRARDESNVEDREKRSYTRRRRRRDYKAYRDKNED